MTPTSGSKPATAHLHLLALRTGALGGRVSVPFARMRTQALSAAFHNDSASPFNSMLAIADQLPLVGPLRRLAGNRWNTADSSRPSDFAICYRLSRQLGVQVIPGDLTPSKLPVPRMVSVTYPSSGMGVMAGVTLRLGSRH